MKLQELKAGLRGIKWIRNNLSGYEASEETLRRQELFREMRRDAEVEYGNFVYYVVTIGTNIRESIDNVPIIFESLYSADCECGRSNCKRPISIAAYNRLYGRFMVTDDYWKRTY